MVLHWMREAFVGCAAICRGTRRPAVGRMFALAAAAGGLSIAVPAARAQYCPAGSDTCGTADDDERISEVVFGTIDNVSGVGDGPAGCYSDFTSISTTVAPGQSYPITVYNAAGYIGDQGAGLDRLEPGRHLRRWVHERADPADLQWRPDRVHGNDHGPGERRGGLNPNARARDVHRHALALRQRDVRRSRGLHHRRGPRDHRRVLRGDGRRMHFDRTGELLRHVPRVGQRVLPEQPVRGGVLRSVGRVYSLDRLGMHRGRRVRRSWRARASAPACTAPPAPTPAGR